MYSASVKTKIRLAKRRLRNRGISFEVDNGQLWFMELAHIPLPLSDNLCLMIEGNLPVMPFTDDMPVSRILAGRISRLTAIYDKQKQLESATDKSELAARAEDASGEFLEFMKHISNPRVQVL